MFFSLDVLPAHKGDCLMLHYGSKKDPHLILIDGGPADVYRPQLAPRLARVHAARDLDEKARLPVDVVLVSHIDDDHIRGILELTKDQLGNNPDLPLKVGSLWHNSFDDLLSKTPEELLSGFGAASFTASASRNSAFDGVETEKEEERQAVDVLASISQGRQLRDDREALEQNSNPRREWRLNHKFKEELILATASSKPVTLDGDLKITVVGPMKPELAALQKAHDKWLREQKKKGKKKSAEAMLAAFADKSVPNLSSIVVLAELGGKSMLLTGDARGDRILDGLELARLVKKGGKLSVDILKVPHHGSSNNMETGFFKRVVAEHYVFSGDGQHGNPERETLEMLLKARGVDAKYNIHLTYSLKTIDAGRKADWEKERTKEQNRKKKNPAGKTKVRAKWSPEQHGLIALFKKNPKFEKKLTFVDPKKPHLIDLLDAVKL
jgi:beta-lactamase superfamily II metal-dependent hydrolase